MMGTARSKNGANVEAQLNAMLGVHFAKGTLLNATSVVTNMSGCPVPATIAVDPVASDTIRVEYSLNGGDTWKPWPAGDVTTYTEYRLVSSVTDVRITRQAGSGTTSTWSIA